jgi:hypothetical protein
MQHAVDMRAAAAAAAVSDAAATAAVTVTRRVPIPGVQQQCLVPHGAGLSHGSAAATFE